MKICRFTIKDDPASAPRLGVVDGDEVRDVTAIAERLPPLRWPLAPGDQFIAHLDDLRPALADLSALQPAVPLDRVALLSPVANPSKFICGAGNWKHYGVPFGKMGFMGKAATALAGPSEGLQLRWPDRVTLHEPELAIVIGRECVNASVGEALDYVAGYCCAFDTTLQPDGEDWAFCKSFDTYGTIGPWLVTADEIPDPSELSYKFWVDDELRGERNFADLAGSPAKMVAFASSAMTLYPGDLILSGAADVGPIAPGETMTMEIPRIGRMTVAVRTSANARAAAATA
jgi:2,4-didehydro-3-deoxy-L-rhamnonate hydrolase